MQQNSEKWWGTFKAGLFASVALHAIAAALLMFDLPMTPPRPAEEEVVKVEMVPEPETKPEPEKKFEPEKKPEPEEKPEPQEKPEPEKKPQEDAKPGEKTVEKPEEKPAEKADQQPVEKPLAEQAAAEKADAQKAEAAKTEARKTAAQPLQPQAFESAAKQGGTEAGGDRPSEPEKKAEPEPRAERALAQPSQQAPEQVEANLRKPLDTIAETPAAARLPQLNLPEAATANPVLNEGEALIETVPIPQAKPQDRPVDAALSDPQKIASADGSEARPSRPTSALKQTSELYSADTLSDPRVRQALGKLPRDRRIVQMCMIETLEQVRRTREDTVPQGLFFDPRNGSPISGQVMTANGAAYKTAQGWIDVDFTCTVNAEADGIAAFSFAVGGAVPKSQWQARRFPKN